MKKLICFALFLAVMLLCVVRGLSVAWALWTGILLFSAAALQEGCSLRRIAKGAWQQGKKMLIVLRIFVIIGCITALWRSGGVIAFFIYHGIRVIKPSLFVLITFLLTSLISFALGTSLGVIGTAGIILMALARSGGVDPSLVAGALLSAAYFGDRCSPAASSAALVAAVTQTRLEDNLRNMHRTGWLPFVLTAGVYAVLSVRHPLMQVGGEMLQSLRESFSISLWALVPAAVMLLLPLCRVPIRLCMWLSVAAAGAVTVLVQGMPLPDMLKTAVMGYHPQGSALGDLLSGGGMVSMVDPGIKVFSTGLLAGVLAETGALEQVRGLTARMASKVGLYPTCLCVSLVSATVFCNQSIAIVMGVQLLEQVYLDRGADRTLLAIDLENTGTVLSPLVPWNIAVAIPLAMLDVTAAAIPYAVLLYMIPLVYGFTRKYYFPKEKKQHD